MGKKGKKGYKSAVHIVDISTFCLPGLRHNAQRFIYRLRFFLEALDGAYSTLKYSHSDEEAKAKHIAAIEQRRDNPQICPAVVGRWSFVRHEKGLDQVNSFMDALTIQNANIQKILSKLWAENIVQYNSK